MRRNAMEEEKNIRKWRDKRLREEKVKNPEIGVKGI